MSHDDSKPVLVLGAGINGTALARELVLNRVPVVLLDEADIASGTTAYSSRLIHGGLRYLEFAEFDLVRESLRERETLLRIASHLVHPLRLFIPARNRFGGLWQSVARFLFRRSVGRHKPRGLWLVRTGLWLYDRFARSKILPPHEVQRVGKQSPAVNPNRYRWLCSYYDAQIPYPERICVEFLEDARQMAQANGTRFSVWTYCQAARHGNRVELQPKSASVEDWGEDTCVEPSMIVNATGAWLDNALKKINVASPRLVGGTRGSHIVTSNATLARELTQGGIYAEAPDGRPIFLLPFGSCTLIGTTDIREDGDVRDVVATPAEVDYLIDAASAVLPQCRLTRRDVLLTYAGVRPLPHVESGSTGAITRRHALLEHANCEIPTLSLVGGKITTCRSLAQEACAKVMDQLGRTSRSNSSARPLPGAVDFPQLEAERDERIRALATRYEIPIEQARAAWELCGGRSEAILDEIRANQWPLGADLHITNTQLPSSLVRWIIQNQWVKTLDDLVERRLMLLFEPTLSVATLYDLAEILHTEGLVARDEVDTSVQGTRLRLRDHFARDLR